MVGEVVGAIVGGHATKQAADAQADAADRATDAQKQMYEQTRKDLEPFRKQGYAANSRLAYLMGLEDVAFDRDAIREQYRNKYFGGQSKKDAPAQTGNQYIDESPFVLPQQYVHHHIPKVLHNQFLKPQGVK